MVGEPSSGSGHPRAHVLNTWKEIAAYLGRGVRTVQRYEHELHLPVHRIGGKYHASVLAVPEDLDRWLLYAMQQEVGTPWQTGENVTTVHQSILEGSNLRRESKMLRMAHHQQLTILTGSIAALRRTLSETQRKRK